MQAVLYSLVFLGSCVNPVIGVAALLLAHCTFVWPGLYMPVAEIGRFWLADAAILGLAINVLARSTSGFTRNERIRLALVGWFFLSGAFSLAFPQLPGASGKSFAFTLIVRFGMLWIVSLSIARASNRQRWLILWLTVACGVVVAVALSYTTISNDVGFMVRYYMRPADKAANELASEMDWRLRQGMPNRLHVPGMLVCFCLMAFSAAVLTLKWKDLGKARPLFLVTSVVCGFAVYGFRSKSMLVLSLLMLAVLMWLSARRGLRQGMFSVFLLLAVVLGVMQLERRSGYQFLRLTMERFSTQSRIEERSFSGRLTDNAAGLELVAAHPLFGLGATTFESFLPNDRRSTASGFDAHAIVQLAVCAGIPASLLAFAAFWHFLTYIPWKWVNTMPWQVTGLLAGFLMLLAVGIVNAGGILTDQSSLVTLGVFWGLLDGWLARFRRPIFRSLGDSSLHQTTAQCGAAVGST